MHVDFQPPYQWQELNEKAARALGLTDKGGAVQLFSGVGPALIELVTGLSKQFPHKKKVAILRNFDPTLELVCTYLSREGILIQNFDSQILGQPEELNSKVTEDLLFVLVSEDDPLLGHLLKLSSLEKLTELKRVILVKVSHGHHRYLPLPEQFHRYLIRVNSLDSRLALVMASARLRWPLSFAESLILPSHSLSEVEKLKTQEPVSPAAVEKLESLAPAESRRVFGPNDLRLPDRAVLYWTDLDGLAVIERLGQRLNYQLPPPGESTWLETTSLHRWHGVRTMDWLRAHGFNDEMIRGTVLIDHRFISADLPKHLSEIRTEILSIQNG